MKKLLLAGLLATLGLAPALASAQTPVPQPRAPQPQAEEKMLVGEVQSIDESGTQITLKDGTMLLTPPGSMLRPGALEQGMRQAKPSTVICSFAIGASQASQSSPIPGRPQNRSALSRGNSPSWSFCRMRRRTAGTSTAHSQSTVGLRPPLCASQRPTFGNT